MAASVLPSLLLAAAITPAAARDAGILYEIWHAPAAHLMSLVSAAGRPSLTVERVIRSDGKATTNEVYDGITIPGGFNPDIYNYEPQLGFYCLYRPRPGENATANTPKCPNITVVARQHAEWLTTAGFDYVAIDITNWPTTGHIGAGAQGSPQPDMVILRPLEVLAEEWLALRAAGIKTPSIAPWTNVMCGKVICSGGPADGGGYAMWRWLLDTFYNNPKYSDIIYRPPESPTKKLLFVVSPNVPVADNETFTKELESNSGRNDVVVQPMWAMNNNFDEGSWGFFSSCTVPCPSPPPGPVPSFTCPAGQVVDAVDASGDNGSCDCEIFCAADWAGAVKAARPHWTGATAAINGSRLNCECVQASHWCPKSTSCANSCAKAGTPVARDYCVPAPPPPPPTPPGPSNCVTTSMVDVPGCNQRATAAIDGSNPVFEISASASYMAAQCSLPFAAPGHLRGLTLQRLFKEVLEVGAPHLFMSSFNEAIGGRQESAYKANTAIMMGLPYDPQSRTAVFVDTYAAEFGRDMEPSVEAGDRIWRVATSCVQMYKAGRKCTDSAAAQELCCTTDDKEVFANAWSFQSADGTDAMITSNQTEAADLGAAGWHQQCNPVSGPSVFCVDTGLLDGRAGPFMLYNKAVPDNPTRPLYRCAAAADPVNPTQPQTRHFLSTDSACEGDGTMEVRLGFIGKSRGGEMLRALRRCKGPGGRRMHSLDLYCDSDTPDGDSVPLGFVR